MEERRAFDCADAPEIACSPVHDGGVTFDGALERQVGAIALSKVDVGSVRDAGPAFAKEEGHSVPAFRQPSFSRMVIVSSTIDKALAHGSLDAIRSASVHALRGKDLC